MTKILIVEDSRVVVKKLREDLISLGYTDLLVTSSGEEAIKLIKHESINLIIMDIILEGKMDGIEASRVINDYRNIPTIYLTNGIKNYKRLPAACVYLNKPFTKNELRYNIEIVLEQHVLKRKLQAKIQWFSALFKYSTEAIVMFDENFLINGVNKKYKDFFSYDYEHLMDQPISDIIGSHISYHELKRSFLSSQSIEIERELIYDSKDSKHFFIKGIPIFDNERFIGGYLTYIDITVLKRKEQRIRYISEHDAMTGLFNRRYFQKKLDKLSKNENSVVSLIIADINNLKAINDSYGHSRGDIFIQLTARVLRESLPQNAIIARIGGDEFGIILIDQSEELCSDYCEKINEKAKEISNKKKLEKILSISLGYTIQNNTSENGEVLFHKADQQMYQIKKQMKNNEIVR